MNDYRELLAVVTMIMHVMRIESSSHLINFIIDNVDIIILAEMP